MPVRKLAAYFVLGTGALLLPNCSSDPDPVGGSAGTSSGGTSSPTAGTTSGGSPTAGSTSTGGGGSGSAGKAGSSTGGSSTGGGGGGASSAGTGGTSAGGGGAAGSGAGTGGASGTGGGSGGGSAGTGGGSGGAFKLTSPDHMEGAKFADKYTCKLKGFNGSVMPELVWSGAPAGTKSFAITFIDTTIAAKPAPMDANGYHWAIYNIPPETMGLPEEFMTPTGTAKQTGAFLGPCPNFGGGTNMDQYEFTIYALSEASITVSGTGTPAVKAAKTLLEMSNLGKAKLGGTSDASPP